MAYRLKLPDSARIHPVFHVLVLRPFVGQEPANDVLPLPYDLVDGRPPSKPVQIHASRWVLRQGVRVEEYLVSWSDGTLDDATWEPATVIREHYPHLHLEGKVVSEGGGSDTVEEPRATEPTHEVTRRMGTRARRAPSWQKEFEMY